PDNPVNNQSTISYRNVFNARQELIRIDHNLNSKWSLFGRYLQDSIPTVEPLGIFTSGVTIPGVASSTTNSPGRSVVVRATDIVTPNVLLDFGYSWSYGSIQNQITGSMSTENSPDVANATKSIMAYQPTLGRIPSITGALGTLNGTGPYNEYNKDHNIFGNVSWVRGKHAFKFGGTYHYYVKTENAAGTNAGSYTFNSTGAAAFYPVGSTSATQTLYNNAQAWANFLLGNAASFTQAAADITPYIRLNQFEAYAQDEFRLNQRLTLSYGIRYSYFPQPYNTNDALLSNFDPSQY